MFCGNCGKELTGTPEFCPHCGAKPLTAHSFCQNCGAAITPATESCVKCGARVSGTAPQSSKNKTVSVLLAVFLTYWTWLYTYKKDTWKFWVGLGISILNTILFIGSFGWWGFIGWIFWVGLWIWSVVDVAVKKGEWYEHY